MINVLICDDSGKQVVLMRQAILNYQTQKGQVLFQVFAALSTKDASKYIDSKHIDVAILDIEIDEKTGIDIAKEIQIHNPNCKIIFITNYESFAYSAYQIEAFSYILKPLDNQKLFHQLDKILSIYQKDNLFKKYNSFKLEIRFKGKTTYIPQGDILYIEKKGKNVVVITDDAAYEYTDNLKDLEKKLDRESFLRCHNGFIVNIKRITSYKRSEIFIDRQNICIPVSKANIPKVASILEKKIWENVL